jgi:hypothetical protein
MFFSDSMSQKRPFSERSKESNIRSINDPF